MVSLAPQISSPSHAGRGKCDENSLVEALPAGFFEFAAACAPLDIHAGAIALALAKLRRVSDVESDMDVDSDDPMRHLSYAEDLQAAARGAVFLADGLAFTADGLQREFPELRLFGLGLGDAFAESAIPGVWTETPRFAALRSLSRMRREIRRAGLCDVRGAAVVQALLGM